MIRHMALYTLTSKAHQEGVDFVIKKLDLSVKKMVGKVPGLLYAEVKKNLAKDSDHDLLFYSEFENMDLIAPYLKSDIHQTHAAMAEDYVENKEGIDVEV